MARAPSVICKPFDMDSIRSGGRVGFGFGLDEVGSEGLATRRTLAVGAGGVKADAPENGFESGDLGVWLP